MQLTNHCLHPLLPPDKTLSHMLIADNPRDAFRGQSRSPNIISFHMLSMVSY